MAGNTRGNGRGRRAGLVVLLGLVLLALAVLAPAAGAARTAVWAYRGNVTTCSDVEIAADGFLGGIDDTTTDGTYTSGDGKLSVQITMNADKSGFTFTALTGIVKAVVVKGGPAYNLYVYTGVSGETDTVVTPEYPNPGMYPAISHAFFCYDEETVETTTTTTEPPVVTTEGTVVTTTTVDYGPGDSSTTTSTTVAVSAAGETSTTVAAAAAASGTLPRTGSGSNALAALGLTMVLGGLTLMGLDRRPARSRS